MLDRRALLCGASGLLASACALAPQGADPEAREWPAAPLLELETFARESGTTGLLILQGRRTILERNWPVGPEGAAFAANFVHGRSADGALLEDVASQQKSFTACLLYIGREKGLIDFGKSVTSYIGPGWSRAAPAEEAGIRLIHLMEMSSGLTEQLTREAPAGERFFYNTPAYAVLKRVLSTAAARSLEDLTREWLAEPAGMAETAWRPRPQAFGDVGNPTGLVTTPRDIARFGRLILSGGKAENGRRVLKTESVSDMLAPSRTNPAYAKLWWRNDSSWSIGAGGRRLDTNLIQEAPRDLLIALGAQDRKLFLSPERDLIVVRTGRAAGPGFDGRFWTRLSAVLPG